MFKRKTAYTWAGILIALTAILLVYAAIIPFRFESPSIFYKFGFEKFLLRAGKVIGLLAAVLLLYQLLLAARLKILDRIFSLPRLYRFHAVSAFIIAVLVLLHPACLLISEDLYTLPLARRYWPEWVGAGLLVLILCQVVFAKWRRSFSIPYHKWRNIHRIMGVIVIGAMAAHVLNVSKTFEEKGIPRMALMVALGCWAVLWVFIRLTSRRRMSFTVKRVIKAGKDAYAIHLRPAENLPFPYAPGQFCFLSVDAAGVSKEPHPFTVASTPTRPDALEIIVRCCGDWTDGISSLKKGNRVFIHGPFGRFTHVLEPPDREIIMIAGGIGITPMLSMLRHMRDQKDSRPVTLIWSNRSDDYLFYGAELEEMKKQLTRFSWIPVFTRQKGASGFFGRLDQNALKDFLTESRRDAAVFVCGPPPMIRQIRLSLKRLGFRGSAVKTELFSF